MRRARPARGATNSSRRSDGRSAQCRSSSTHQQRRAARRRAPESWRWRRTTAGARTRNPMRARAARAQALAQLGHDLREVGDAGAERGARAPSPTPSRSSAGGSGSTASRAAALPPPSSVPTAPPFRARRAARPARPPAASCRCRARRRAGRARHVRRGGIERGAQFASSRSRPTNPALVDPRMTRFAPTDRAPTSRDSGGGRGQTKTKEEGPSPLSLVFSPRLLRRLAQRWQATARETQSNAGTLIDSRHQRGSHRSGAAACRRFGVRELARALGWAGWNWAPPPTPKRWQATALQKAASHRTLQSPAHPPRRARVPLW